jgi:hypothetical protein
MFIFQLLEMKVMLQLNLSLETTSFYFNYFAAGISLGNKWSTLINDVIAPENNITISSLNQFCESNISSTTISNMEMLMDRPKLSAYDFMSTTHYFPNSPDFYYSSTAYVHQGFPKSELPNVLSLFADFRSSDYCFSYSYFLPSFSYNNKQNIFKSKINPLSHGSLA